MARESAATVAGKMLRVLSLVNDLARTSPHDELGEARGVGVQEFAGLLGMKVEEVERLIGKINMGCGEALPELYVDYDEAAGVVVPREMSFALERPLRLTAGEARGLLTALESAGIDQAEGVFKKVEGAFPPVSRAQFDAIRTAAAQGGQSTALAAVTRAVETRTPLAIAYRGLGDPVAARRVVEPRELTYDAREQAWYVCAYCRMAAGWRTFRVDRIEQVEELPNERFTQLDDASAPHGLAPIDDAPMAVLAVYDPRAVSDTRMWRGMVRVDAPLPQDAKKIADKPGAYVAAVPWSQGSPWLPQAVAQALGGVEVLRPLELKALAREAAVELLGFLGADGV